MQRIRETQFLACRPVVFGGVQGIQRCVDTGQRYVDGIVVGEDEDQRQGNDQHDGDHDLPDAALGVIGDGKDTGGVVQNHIPVGRVQLLINIDTVEVIDIAGACGQHLFHQLRFDHGLPDQGLIRGCQTNALTVNQITVGIVHVVRREHIGEFGNLHIQHQHTGQLVVVAAVTHGMNQSQHIGGNVAATGCFAERDQTGLQPICTDLFQNDGGERTVYQRIQCIKGTALIAVYFIAGKIQPHVGDILVGGVGGYKGVQLRVFCVLILNTDTGIGVGVDHGNEIFVQLLHHAQTEIDINLPLLRAVLQAAGNAVFHAFGVKTQKQENADQGQDNKRQHDGQRPAPYTREIVLSRSCFSARRGDRPVVGHRGHPFVRVSFCAWKRYSPGGIPVCFLKSLEK